MRRIVNYELKSPSTPSARALSRTVTSAISWDDLLSPPCILNAPAMRPPRWEYKSLQMDVAGWLGPDVDPEQIDRVLDANGAEGWELVSAFDVNRGQGRTTALVFLFKRPRD